MSSLIFAITQSNSKTQVEDDSTGEILFPETFGTVQRFSELPIISANNRGR